MTANVDFAYLTEAVRDAVNVHGPQTQGAFLRNMGLDVRLAKLAEGKTESEKKDLASAALRLVAPTGMGNQYKVLGMTSSGGRESLPAEKVVWPFVEGHQQDGIASSRVTTPRV